MKENDGCHLCSSLSPLQFSFSLRDLLFALPILFSSGLAKQAAARELTRLQTTAIESLEGSTTASVEGEEGPDIEDTEGVAVLNEEEAGV
jgi:hypothetical protein